MRSKWFPVLCAIGVVSCIEHDFKGFDDTVLFGINWPGGDSPLDSGFETDTFPPTEIPFNADGKEVLRVTTANKEKYACRLPELKDKESTNIEEYNGPTPVALLKPLFQQKICSYRLESYWSYEVCHGRYIRQYHEEREGKQVKTQEYFLGYWTPEKQMKIEDAAKAAQENKVPLKYTKVEGQSIPYVEMVMDEGTLCDLSGNPRITRVHYVCYVHGKHEVYSFKETSTCEYEIVILSSLLCEHPQFKSKDPKETVIECVSQFGAPKKPRDLLKQEVDTLRFYHQSIRLMNSGESKDMLAVLKVEKIDKDGETHLKFELHPLEDEENIAGDASRKSSSKFYEKPPVITDDSPVRAFLNGENCLNGGTGWWKYEFCYGKHVVQYHVGRTGEKITLNLGKFDEAAHIAWVKENKGKAPKPVEQRSSISHFYSNGDICDKTGKARQTEVKLKCLENSSSPAQVSLYLLEPRTCHYILGVESPLICELLPLADENGLIKQDKPLLTWQDQQDAVVEVTDEKESENKEEPKFGND